MYRLYGALCVNQHAGVTPRIALGSNVTRDEGVPLPQTGLEPRPSH